MVGVGLALLPCLDRALLQEDSLYLINTPSDGQMDAWVLR